MGREIDFVTILTDHLQRYPAMEIEDVYKLVHQAALGSDHAVKVPQHAREWLEREIHTLGSGPQEPVIDPLSVDGRIVRVHLRPFLVSHGDTDALLKAFIRTANQFPGSVDNLRTYWRAAEELAWKGELNLPLQELQSFFNSVQKLGFPAMHHSDAYTKLYLPAYRVVARDYMEGLFPGT